MADAVTAEYDPDLLRALERIDADTDAAEQGTRCDAPAVIDAAHLATQRAWSLATFGPGPRTRGVLDHIRKELPEIEADPRDVTEWVDVVILAFDGAWRHGAEPQEIIDAIKAKQARNEARTWPDWRSLSPDQAIEHDRTAERATPRLRDVIQKALDNSDEDYQPSPGQTPSHVAHRVTKIAAEAVVEAGWRPFATEHGWQPGDPCSNCGSRDTRYDPADGASCAACGATDGDE